MEPEALIKAGVIRKGRAKRGRTHEVKLPGERFKDLAKTFRERFRKMDQLFLFPDMEEAKFDIFPPPAGGMKSSISHPLLEG